MKQDFVERVNREMAADFPTADLPAREALAGACRILAREGHESGLAGQVTARAEKAGSERLKNAKQPHLRVGGAEDIGR